MRSSLGCLCLENQREEPGRCFAGGSLSELPSKEPRCFAPIPAMRDPFGSPGSLPFSSSSSLPAPAGTGVCVLLLWLLLLSTSSAIGWSLEGLAASCPSPSVRPLVGWVPKDAATVRQLTTRAARAIRTEAAHPRHLCHAPPARSFIHARTGLSCRQVLSGDGGDSSEGVAPGEAILSGMGSPRLRRSRRVRVLQQHLCNFSLFT